MSHSIQICHKAAGIFFIILVLTFSSCTQSADLMATSPEDSPVYLKSAKLTTAEYPCNPKSVPFIDGQNNTAGVVDLSVNPDNGNILVSVSTQNNWAFKGIQIFIGSQAEFPVNNGGNLQMGNFPVNMRFSGYRTTFGYELVVNANSVSTDDEGRAYIVVAVHADIDQLDANGRVLQSESAWMDGTRITTRRSWAAWYRYYLMPCVTLPPE
jgi:hypothetical protein